MSANVSLWCYVGIKGRVAGPVAANGVRSMAGVLLAGVYAAASRTPSRGSNGRASGLTPTVASTFP